MKQTISKKIISVLSICSLLVIASSCSDSIVENQGHEDRGVKMTFMAAFEGNETRASIVEGTPDGVKDIVWNAGDEISVLTNVPNFENVRFALTTGANSTSGSFTGTTAADAANYAGLYPYQGYVSLDGNKLQKVTVPSLQHATDNTFDPKAAPMIGVTTKSEQTFNFKNVCAFVKVTPKAACKSITLEATGGTYLSGSVNVDYNNDVPTCTNPSGNPLSSKVTLVGDIKAGNTYYIAVLPQTIASGNLKITYQTSDKYLRATVKKDVVLERSKYYDVSATSPSSFEQGTSLYVDLGVSVLWATRNLGASKTSEFGIPYAWGEIAGEGESDDANKMNIIRNGSPVKTSFSQENYKYGDGTSYRADGYHMKKYSSKFPIVDEDEYVDYVVGDIADATATTNLVSADDAANVAWNDGCRMPTKDEIQELIDNCHWEYYESGAIKGYWVYKKSTEANHAYTESDPRIFLRIADYWSSTVYNIPNSNNQDCYYEKAYGLRVGAGNSKNVDGIDRYKGLYIRPVKSINHN
ncbi:MAG: fimbrillin family protein [Prevotellaceae bacterium]|nr:fimbrillin family protein [Candidatus Minthosoma equi]